jgi:hypothetical protein
MTVSKSMMLVTSRRDGAPTFRMIPVSLECPYIEATYIPQARAMVIFLKDQVEGFHMVPHLDSNGDPVKSLSKRSDGSPYKQERRTIKTCHEAYITEKEEIKSFVEMFACNLDFDYQKFMIDPKIMTGPTQETTKIITDIN